MATVKQIKTRLIDRILTIKNKDFLLVLDNLLASSTIDVEEELTPTQIELLENSEKDIKNGLMISQEAMDKRNLEWLNESLWIAAPISCAIFKTSDGVYFTL